ncbi:hypothetical protein [Roseicella aquatilis]|uniref:Uncharacterized protein n=1 Tax=Roseicella aquatilis TaxID=2527868 RepID=A0A4R4DVZ2_9PROT|nr:hypothetical protein [Roseicella aquatilis]TCZ64851.1 hypothetical protein EXY23_05605 [Roseicella aquatilis]
MTEDVWLSLDGLIAEREARRARERAEEAQALAQKAEAARTFAAAFEAYRLTAEDRDAIMRRIARAFHDGEKELMLFAFPSDLCTDGGRRIHNGLKGWEETLPGAARQVHAFWRDALRPRGFRFFCRVVTFPEGMPGDVGVFFSWPKELEE